MQYTPCLELILPLVALGSVDATHPDCLFENDIESVLSLGTSEYKTVDFPLKSHLYFKLDDSPEDAQALKDILQQCIQFIEQETAKQRRVLVHCGAGISRSATVVVAYVMRYKQMSFTEALQYVKDRKPDIAPNRGFLNLLQTFDAKKDDNKKQTHD